MNYGHTVGILRACYQDCKIIVDSFLCWFDKKNYKFGKTNDSVSDASIVRICKNVAPLTTVNIWILDLWIPEEFWVPWPEYQTSYSKWPETRLNCPVFEWLKQDGCQNVTTIKNWTDIQMIDNNRSGYRAMALKTTIRD